MEEEKIALLEKLGKNPIFHLSMSSIELFHSNFIYWFINQIPKQDIPKFFRKNLDSQKNIPEVAVMREKENIDLLIKVWYNGKDTKKKADYAIVIENKFKSFPTNTQLEKYEDKKIADKTDYILLALSDIHTRKVKPAWEVVNYKELAEWMMEYTALAIRDEPNNKVIIEYYLDLIEAMHEFFHNTGMDEDNLQNEPFIKKYADNFKEILQELRFESFLEKQRSEWISYKIYERLNDKLKGELVEFSTIINFEAEDFHKPRIFVKSGFTRAQGIIDIKYQFKKDIAIGIQIQGKQYRRIIECAKSKSAIGEIKKYRDRISNLSSLNWFNLEDKVGGNPDRLYPKKDKAFNKYGEIFFYKCFYIQDESVDCIINYVIEDILLLESNISLIESIVID
jgi:hypothetical protein